MEGKTREASTMSARVERSAPGVGGWHVEQALDLLEGLNALTRTFSLGIAGDGDFEGVEVEWVGGWRESGPSALAAAVGATLAVIEVTAAEWGMPMGLMEQEEQRRRHWVGRRYVTSEGSVVAGVAVLDALAAATYGVAATVVACGELDQVEVPPTDDADLGGVTWLTRALGAVRAEVFEATLGWGLPQDVMRKAEAEKAAYLRAEWGHDGT